MPTFEDLRVFQRALDLMVDIYRATETFPKHELFGFVSQLRRASGSIVSNIAEGQGRLTFGEWRQMLSHARGSLYEVQAQVIAARRLGYISEETLQHLKKRSRTVGKLLAGLIDWVKERETTSNRPKRESASSNKQRVTSNEQPVTSNE